ncbi:hypothetical protein CRG98_007310 [Punica granatum]|uniref:Retrotransposon gag domain-containing protein n=1 Tax=Punica granatum TaxID=22663 RepID=A0A2I0KWR7_PUNGR|nr:hypothetical protein CRG98_007310 [Punica granatum]
MEALLARVDTHTVPMGRSLESRRSHDHKITPIPRATPTSAPEAESSTQAAMRAELQSIREERDRLRCELVDSCAEVADYRELQMELAQACARVATLDREMARLSATLDRPPAPTAVPLPPATFLSSEQALSAPPPISMPAPATVYTIPPPMSKNVGLKRMEETIRALQASETRPHASYGDYSLFLGMRLPSKFKIPKFKTYEGTTDPRHHLRHYRGKMLQYLEYEEFVIHSFQDSLSGSALDWFITKEMVQGQMFEEYATKWHAQAAKHIPPISEVQQIQLFHSTLRGVYYSHLLAHTSSFFDLIEAGKKLDLGIKLGRMEGPTSKGEESSKKVPTTTSSSSGRRGKEFSVNAVNPAHSTPQQYSVNLTTAPTVAPAYFPPPP